jgi:hypothetical protein
LRGLRHHRFFKSQGAVHVDILTATTLCRQCFGMSTLRFNGPDEAMATLKDRLDEFKRTFESGAPPYNAPREAIAVMYRATDELSLSALWSCSGLDVAVGQKLRFLT